MIITASKGIAQNDIVVRTMLIEAFRRLRAEPYLFDYIFSNLIQDSLTRKEYGERQLDKARDWFMSNDLPVVNIENEDLTLPKIVVAQQGSDEVVTESTLGDTNYQPTESVPASQIVALPLPTIGPFSPLSYVSATGTVTLPPAFTTTSVYPGMMLVDTTTGQYFPIVDIIDGQNFTIAIGSVAGFVDAIIAPASNLYIARLESGSYRESYRIEPHIPGKAPLSIYMNSILVWCLNRYKKELLERRGFERTVITSGPPERYKGATNPEIVWVRAITITGYSRYYWPTTIKPLVQGVGIAIDFDSNTDIGADATSAEAAQGWDTILEDEQAF